MSRCVSLVLSASALLLALGLASSHVEARDTRSAFGTVLQVDPIIESVDVPIANEECFEQPVRYREPPRYRSARHDRAPAILGAIVGGVIGNQFGRGGGRDVATAAGAALGYASVRDSQHYQGGYYRDGREYTRYEQRCVVRNQYREEEQVTGYDVTYEYQGETYRTVTDYHPGDSIELIVDVRPVR